MKISSGTTRKDYIEGGGALGVLGEYLVGYYKKRIIEGGGTLGVLGEDLVGYYKKGL